MNEYTKQIVFSKENVTKYYLSPFVTIYKDESSFSLERKDMDKCLRIHHPFDSQAIELLTRLSEGMDAEKLCDFLVQNFKEENPKDWIKFCVQWGMLE